MAKPLLLILIVALAPAIVIPLGFPRGLSARQLINYKRLTKAASQIKFLVLINCRKLHKLVTCSKVRAMFTWAGLLKLADCLRSFKLACSAKLKELLSRFRSPRLVSHSKLSELMARVSLLSQAAWSKLHDLIDRTELARLISRTRVLSLIGRLKLWLLRESHSSQSIPDSAQPNLNVLNCRVRPNKQQKDDSVPDVFTVEICGSIRAPSDTHYATLRVFIEDVTGGPHKAMPVQAHDKRWRMQNSAGFCYSADLGKLPNQVTTLSDWTTVAQLNRDWLMFPRKGPRVLRITTFVLSQQTGKELGTAQYILSYDNPALGYDDLQENVQRTRTLAVALAFAVSAADHKLYGCEVEVIRNWAKSNIGISRPVSGSAHPLESPKPTQASDKAERKLDKAFEQAVRFFRDGNQLDAYKICTEIVGIAPLADRYDILDLCLNVVKAKGLAVEEELAILKNLASWLEVDADRFRAMMEKILPVSMHHVKDAEVILGVTSEMSEKETLRQLNRQYSKWNSRVTSSDPQVQAQADQMLKLIADARAEYMA
jgi:hypothetical protein